MQLRWIERNGEKVLQYKDYTAQIESAIVGFGGFMLPKPEWQDVPTVKDEV